MDKPSKPKKHEYSYNAWNVWSCGKLEIQKNANRNINAKGYMVGEHTCNCEYKILSN